MTRTLFVSDLDGTLLDANAQLSEESRAILNRCIANGALFTVATARTPATVNVLMRGVNMLLPGIVLTGAALWDFNTGTYSDVRFIEADVARTVADAFAQNGVSPFVYTLDTSRTPNLLEVYYNNVSPSDVDAAFIRQRCRLPLKKFHLREDVPTERIPATLIFFASGSPDVISRVAEQIKATTRCAVANYDDIYNPGTALIEVFAPGVSKAAAIESMKNRYDVDRVVVFGDNMNDLSMFEIADVSVAVANANPRVLEEATLTIGFNTENAVPRFVLESDMQKIR